MAECETCDRWFGSVQAANQHMNDTNHYAAKYECEACNARFYNILLARHHMDTQGHWRNHWCSECSRGFQNANNLQMHLRGSAHMKGSIACPFCKKSHTTASGVAHHLESGACPRARHVNREVIYNAIRQKDTTGVITMKQIAWNDEMNGTFTAGQGTLNRRTGRYECYLCHKDFAQLNGLNQHLNSPIHKQKIYRCFGHGCRKEFGALAQLFGHLESERCGATRFDVVQRNAASVLTGQRMIAW